MPAGTVSHHRRTLGRWTDVVHQSRAVSAVWRLQPPLRVRKDPTQLGVAILCRRPGRAVISLAVWALPRTLVAVGLAERVPFLSPRADYPSRTFTGRRRQNGVIPLCQDCPVQWRS